MELEKDEKIIKKKYDFGSPSAFSPYADTTVSVNDRSYSGIIILLTNKRFHIKPALGRLNGILPLLPSITLDINIDDINNYSVRYVRYLIFSKMPKITIKYKNSQQFSFCVAKKELKDWEEKLSKLSINLSHNA